MTEGITFNGCVKFEDQVFSQSIQSSYLYVDEILIMFSHGALLMEGLVGVVLTVCCMKIPLS